MKLAQLAAVAALAVATVACSPEASTAANANTASSKHGVETSKAHDISANPEAVNASTSHAPAKASAPRLGPEYEKIGTFVEFRKKLLADGWQPVACPHCHKEMMGTYYDEYCSAHQDDIECRVCDMVPEIFLSTSNGHMGMGYIKDGTPLTVSAYGDIRDLDEPGKWGLVVTGWDYTDQFQH